MIVGEGTVISPVARIHGAERIKIGRNCRIDDFVVLSAGEGGIEIGDHVHIGAHCLLVGAGRIELHDYSGLSGRVSIYSASGDYRYAGCSGSPCDPDQPLGPIVRPVVVGRGAVVGAHAVIMPGAVIGAGAAVGAHALVLGTLDCNGFYKGQEPARKAMNRRWPGGTP